MEWTRTATKVWTLNKNHLWQETPQLEISVLANTSIFLKTDKKTSKVLKNNPAKKRAYLVPSIYSVKYYKERRGELFILVLLFWTNFFKTEPPLEVIIRFYSALHSFHIFNENKREQLYTFV